MLKILVTPPVTAEHKRLLDAAGGPDAELIYRDAGAVDAALMQEVDILFGNVAPALVAGAKKLRLLQLFSAGTDGYIPVLPAGCALTNTSGAFGLAISEHMLGMLLMLQKRLHQYRDNQHACVWKDMGNVTSIEGATIVTLGLGDIGGEFARKVKLLGAYTIGVRRRDTNKPPYLDELCLTEELDRVLPRADVLAMALPGMPETRHILDARRIGLLKDGAIVLNVGRGSAIDLDALADAIALRGIRAGLDVTDPEPLPPEHRLWKLENALITPHVSGYFHLPETLNRMVRIAAENIARLREGKPYLNAVDLSTGYRADKYAK